MLKRDQFRLLGLTFNFAQSKKIQKAYTPAS
jgi:hypothetical protein